MSVAIFGVTFLFSYIFFFIHRVAPCRFARSPLVRETEGIVTLFFFLQKKREWFLGKASFAWSFWNSWYKSRKRIEGKWHSGRVTGSHRDLRGIHSRSWRKWRDAIHSVPRGVRRVQRRRGSVKWGEKRYDRPAEKTWEFYLARFLILYWADGWENIDRDQWRRNWHTVIILFHMIVS